MEGVIETTMARKDSVIDNSEKSEHLPYRFGQFGGQFAPEALVDCLNEIEQVLFIHLQCNSRHL